MFLDVISFFVCVCVNSILLFVRIFPLLQFIDFRAAQVRHSLFTSENTKFKRKNNNYLNINNIQLHKKYNTLFIYEYQFKM